MHTRARIQRWIRHRMRAATVAGVAAFAIVTIANSTLHTDVWSVPRDAWDQDNQQWFLLPFGMAIAGLFAALMGLVATMRFFRKQAALAKARRLVPIAVRHSAVGDLAARRKITTDLASLLFPVAAAVAAAVYLAACLLPGEAGLHWARLLVYLWAAGGHLVIAVAIAVAVVAFTLFACEHREDLARKFNGWRRPSVQAIPEQERAALLARAASAGLDPEDPDLAMALIKDYSRTREQALALERRLDRKTAAAKGQATQAARL